MRQPTALNHGDTHLHNYRHSVVCRRIQLGYTTNFRLVGLQEGLRYQNMRYVA